MNRVQPNRRGAQGSKNLVVPAFLPVLVLIAPLCPTLKQPLILQMQLLKFRWTSQIEFRRVVTIVDGREIAVRGAKVGENGLRLVPVLEWQFTLHALVVGLGDRRHFIGFATPLEPYAGVGPILRGQGAWRRRQPGEIV